MLSKVHPKGQIVIPVALRHKYGIEIGDKIEFIPKEGYLKLIKSETKGLMDLAGIIKSKKPFPDKETIRKVTKDVAIKRNVK